MLSEGEFSMTMFSLRSWDQMFVFRLIIGPKCWPLSEIMQPANSRVLGRRCSVLPTYLSHLGLKRWREVSFFDIFPDSVCEGFFVKNICRTTYHLHLHIFTSAHPHSDLYLCSCSHLHIYISAHLHILTSTSHSFTSRFTSRFIS